MRAAGGASSRERFDELMIRPDASLLDALRAIDGGAAGLALVVDRHRHLLGVVTDGDVRRALLAGATLTDGVDPFIRRDPVAVPATVTRAHVVDLMRARRLDQIPIVDADNTVIGLHLLTDVIGPQDRPNLAVVMAGGRGSRLGRVTDSLPKPMVPVAGRPILEWIVLHLVSSGIRDIVLSVGYLSDRIVEHFGDGDRFGCRVRYLHDEPERPRGSGGALASLPAQWRNAHPIVVMNGDLLTQFDLAQMIDRHARSRAELTVAVRAVHHEVAFGVVHADDDGMMLHLQEKPQLTWDVNAGIYLIESRVLDLIPPSGEYPLTELIDTCLAQQRRVATWALTDEWADIGQPLDLVRARGGG